MSTICDDLRAAILQAAMQGRLTKQLPEDGDAQQLLEKIYAQKINNRKTKKLEEITDKDLPFEIPSSWRWVRTGFICDIISGTSYSSKDIASDGIRIYRGGNVVDGGLLKDLEDDVRIKKQLADEEKKVKKGDVVIVASTGSQKVIGKPCLVTNDNDGYIGAFLRILRVSNAIMPDFFWCYIRSNLYRDAIRSRAVGTNINNVKTEYITENVFPIPPLAEQKRIVEKVDELMARVADLEQSADALASLKKAFPDDIKASLLQAAMQGKLTKQLPEDGSAEDLLEEIRAEKEKLIAKGKIKKQKPLAPITDDEIPFNIPENWKWVRLNDIVVKEIRRGKPPVYDKNGSSFAFAQKCNTKYTGIDLSLAKAISNNSLKKYSEDDAIATSDIIVNSTGTGTLGRVGFIDSKIPMNAKYYPDSHVTIVRVPKFISNYVYAILKNSKKYFEEKGEGSTNQKELKPLTIQNLIIPLPPIAEQKRIIERLNAILQNVNAVGDLIASE